MAKAPVTYSIRKAARYLEDAHGIEIGELRMRTLARDNAIFTNDPNTEKAQVGDSEREEWRVSQKALDEYAKAVKAGGIRSSSTGAKAWKINVDSAQLELLRKFCKDNGIAEPVRANKAYSAKKSVANVNGAAPADAPTLDEMLDEEGDEAVGSDLFAEQDA